MWEQCRRVSAVRSAWILAVLCHAPVGLAHVTSHVDAWMRIDDAMRLRLVVYLDDVVAWHQQRAHRRSIGASAGRPESKSAPGFEPKQIAAQDAERALEAFTDELPELVEIYDASGRIRRGHVVRTPDWKPSGGSVDLRAEGGLRLAWAMEYPWPGDEASFSIQHHFLRHPQPGVDIPDWQPAELRLHVRDEASRRRIDCQIGHHYPHTILLPKSAVGDERRLTQVPVSARLILLPRQLHHEFTIPAVLLTETDPVSGPAQPLNRLRRLAKRSFRVTIDGISVVPDQVSVHLLTANNELISAETGREPIIGRRAGVRMVFAVDSRPETVEVVWNRLPPVVEGLNVHTLAGSVSTSTVLDPVQTGPSGTDYRYIWHPPPAVVQSDRSKTDRRTVSIRHSDLWITDAPRAIPPFAVGAAGMGLSVVCLAAVRISGRQIAWGWYLAPLVVAGAAALCARLVPPAVQPRPDAARTIERMLAEVYRAATISDPDESVDRLRSVLTDSLADSVFQTAVTQPDDQGPMIEVTRLHVTVCRPLSWKGPDTVQFLCGWNVNGDILHWGHRHQRRLFLEGTIRLVRCGSEYRITDIALHEQRSETDASPTAGPP